MRNLTFQESRDLCIAASLKVTACLYSLYDHSVFLFSGVAVISGVGLVCNTGYCQRQ